MYYVNRKDIFDLIWLGKELSFKIKETIFNKYPLLHEIHACVREFREIFIQKSIAYLHLFIEKYLNSTNRNLKSFINGLLRDVYAIENAVSSSLSNGFVEGSNSRLKMIKRMMYGRAGLPLLRAKIVV
jgi:transposase